MKLGVQVSSLKPILKTPEQTAHAFSRIAGMGVDTVQLQWIDPSVPIPDIVVALNENLLKSISVQDFYQSYADNPKYYQELMKATGSRWLCLSRIPEKWKNLQGLKEFAEVLSEISADLERFGMRLCFHPTAPDYQEDNGVRLLDHLMELLPQMDLCLDLYHLNKAGISMPMMIRTYAGRVCMVHFKEGKMQADGKELLVPTGQGDICWDGVMNACEESEVPYGFVEQETWNRDPFDCLAEALNYCRDLRLRSDKYQDK